MKTPDSEGRFIVVDHAEVGLLQILDVTPVLVDDGEDHADFVDGRDNRGRRIARLVLILQFRRSLKRGCVWSGRLRC